ncbi:hypothetical protein BaRGS_00022558 [Batillaria attramentaria]|uniref:Uncharacterized protein n=1 Tax=Batillaria attramentaria TaxID=370345 RepID=A0ABD0KH09_9CAEN
MSALSKTTSEGRGVSETPRRHLPQPVIQADRQFMGGFLSKANVQHSLMCHTFQYEWGNTRHSLHVYRGSQTERSPAMHIICRSRCRTGVSERLEFENSPFKQPTRAMSPAYFRNSKNWAITLDVLDVEQNGTRGKYTPLKGSGDVLGDHRSKLYNVQSRIHRSE